MRARTCKHTPIFSVPHVQHRRHVPQTSKLALTHGLNKPLYKTWLAGTPGYECVRARAHVQARGMACDVSWDGAAEEWEAVLSSTLGRDAA